MKLLLIILLLRGVLLHVLILGIDIVLIYRLYMHQRQYDTLAKCTSSAAASRIRKQLRNKVITTMVLVLPLFMLILLGL